MYEQAEMYQLKRRPLLFLQLHKRSTLFGFQDPHNPALNFERGDVVVATKSNMCI